MSKTTSIIISMSCCESPKAAAFNNILGKNYFKEIDIARVSGGDKLIADYILIACINYFNADSFIEKVKTITFDYPEEVQIFLKEESDEKFKVIDLI